MDKFRKRLNKKGFTLIELVVVVAIVGILAVIAVPAVSDIIKNARTSADEAQVALYQGAIERYNADKGGYPQTHKEALDAIKEYTNIDVSGGKVPAPEQANMHFFYNPDYHKISVKVSPDTGDIQLDVAASPGS